jgi:hypothetical protein
MKTFYHVSPRYTPGIPALAPSYELAKQFTIEERNAYRAALRGEYGIQAKERADRLGLDGIAVTKTMHTDKKGRVTFNVIDIISNKTSVTEEKLPENKYQPLYLTAIEIMEDWEEPDNDISEYILYLRSISLLSDRLSNGMTGAEVVIKLIFYSRNWSSLVSRTIKKNLKKILCDNMDEIEDENMKAVATTICRG